MSRSVEAGGSLLPRLQRDQANARREQLKDRVLLLGMIIAEVKKESEEKRDGRLLRCERQYGYASRTFSLDCEVDEAKTAARYHDGILELTLPKKSPSETRKIAIS